MTNRPTIDWEEAFAYYAGLGVARSFVKVGRRFGVSDFAVGKHAAANGWEARIAKIDAEARQKTDARVLRERSERIEDTLRVIDAARLRFAGQLGRNDFKLTGADFASLVKLEALLEGEPTDRISLQDVQALYGDVLRITRITLVDVLELTVSEAEKRAALQHFDEALPKAIAEIGKAFDSDEDQGGS
jgi:hypothetical protein